MKKRYDFVQWIPLAIIAVILIVIYKTLDNISEITGAIGSFLRILSPLLLGILFTYLLFYPQKKLEKLIAKIKIKKFTFIGDHARVFSTVIVFILFIAVIILALAFVIPAIVSSIADLARNVPSYINSIVVFFENLPSDSVFAGLDIPKFINDNSTTLINTLLNFQGLEQIVRGVSGFAAGSLNVLLGIFLTLYILLYRESLAEYFTRLNSAVFKSEHKRETMVRYVKQINKVLFTFLASRGLDCLINFAVSTLILTLFRVPYAILLGLIAGIFNFIPYIGSILSVAIIGLLTLLTRDLNTAIYVALSLFAFQQLDGSFIGPRIMKTSLKINPILVIMAVVIGGAYFGIVGMFLGVPIAVIIKQILEEYIVSTETVINDDSRR